jgi:hypothetical protein
MTRYRWFPLVIGLLWMACGGTPAAAQGNVWEPLGISATITDHPLGAIYPSLAVASDGTVVVAYVNMNSWIDDITHAVQGVADIDLKRFNGTAWEEVGGSASGRGVSANPDDTRYDSSPVVAVAPDGTVYVAWISLGLNGNGPGVLRIKRWDGNTWGEVGAGSASGGGVSGLPGNVVFMTLAVSPAGVPYVAWTNNAPSGLYVKRWDGSAWVAAGTGAASGYGLNDGSGTGQNPVMAFDAAGLPYVAYAFSQYGSYRIHIQRLNGDAWESVGAGSASGDGVSAPIDPEAAHSGWYPDLVFGPGDTPYLTWQAWVNENWEIYIKRFDGSAWVEVGTGSASTGGVSSTPAFFHHSQHPALTFDGDGILYLAWTELLGDSSRARTYARRFVSGVWEETYPGSASEPIDDSPVAGEIPPEMWWRPTPCAGRAIKLRCATCPMRPLPRR